MLKACASWPAIYILLLHVSLIALTLCSLFVPRYSYGITNARNTTTIRSYILLTHYYYANETVHDVNPFSRGQPVSFEADSDGCAYNGRH